MKHNNQTQINLKKSSKNGKNNQVLNQYKMVKNIILNNPKLFLKNSKKEKNKDSKTLNN